VNEFIQEIPLLHNGKQRIMGCLYKGFPSHFLDQWKSQWKLALENYIKQGKKRPEHSHWSWPKKTTYALMSGREDSFFWIECNEITQGIMLVEQKISYFGGDLGKKNIYISFLEVAPWNYYKDESVGFYKGVGSVLLMAAIQFSDSLGFDGRIALESLPQSENFYIKKKMIPVERSDINGALVYFELPTLNAREILRGLNK
jgi:hypothetical protein